MGLGPHSALTGGALSVLKHWPGHSVSFGDSEGMYLRQRLVAKHKSSKRNNDLGSSFSRKAVSLNRNGSSDKF